MKGISRYVREHRPWALYHEPHGLEKSVPRWLRGWKGDGIIARIQSRHMAKELAATGIPVVDVLGLVPNLRFPLVHVDNGAIGRMAAEHLRERGLRQFGFFGIRGFNGVFAVCFGGVGALLTWRHPRHPVSWILAAAGR